MEILLNVLRLFAAIILAFLAGKLISKLKLPPVLGWLITGMIIGPYAWNLLRQSVVDAAWFDVTESLCECIFGLMIGTELIWSEMKKAGKQIVVTTVTESLGTFAVVSLVFGVIFWFADIPIYLAFMFGGIALATAPAPSLSVVRSMKTYGPVTKTLVPMAALDDLVAAVVFFLVIALVSSRISTQNISIFVMLFLVFLPVLIGIVIGFLAGKLLQRLRGQLALVAVMLLMLFATAGFGFWINSLLPSPILNFMLLGMSFPQCSPI